MDAVQQDFGVTEGALRHRANAAGISLARHGVPRGVRDSIMRRVVLEERDRFVERHNCVANLRIPHYPLRTFCPCEDIVAPLKSKSYSCGTCGVSHIAARCIDQYKCGSCDNRLCTACVGGFSTDEYQFAPDFVFCHECGDLFCKDCILGGGNLNCCLSCTMPACSTCMSEWKCCEVCGLRAWCCMVGSVCDHCRHEASESDSDGSSGASD